MASPSQDDTFQEWESLLKTVRQHQDEIVGIAPFRDALATAHLTAVASRNLRDSYEASAQEETRRLKEALATGRDAVSSLRYYIKGVLGIRSEKLSRYGIKLPRKRPRLARRSPFGPLPS
jgi:hypothetical protein